MPRRHRLHVDNTHALETPPRCNRSAFDRQSVSRKPCNGMASPGRFLPEGASPKPSHFGRSRPARRALQKGLRSPAQHATTTSAGARRRLLPKRRHWAQNLEIPNVLCPCANICLACRDIAGSTHTRLPAQCSPSPDASSAPAAVGIDAGAMSHVLVVLRRNIVRNANCVKP